MDGNINAGPASAGSTDKVITAQLRHDVVLLHPDVPLLESEIESTLALLDDYCGETETFHAIAASCLEDGDKVRIKDCADYLWRAWESLKTFTANGGRG